MADHRTWIELSRLAWRHNLASFQRLVGPSVGVLPVIKAEAYGHGAAAAVAVLRDLADRGFGVAYGEEALSLRRLKYRGRIVVLSNWTRAELPSLLRQKIEVVIWDESSSRQVITQGRQLGLRPKVHIKLDTGTTRIGFLQTQLPFVRRLMTNTNLQVVGVFSHFANAEERGAVRTNEQVKRFTTLQESLAIGQGSTIDTHIACTAAILRYPEARFGLVRLGIGQYGLWPSSAIQDWVKAHIPGFTLRPVLSWYTRLAQIKTVPTGTRIGYGGTVIARRPMRIGILPIGYADGLSRRASNRAHVTVGRQRVPVVGRVCMNLTMIDLTTAPRVCVDDVVTLIGASTPVEDLAVATDTIAYETVTGLNWSNPRLIV